MKETRKKMLYSIYLRENFSTKIRARVSILKLAGQLLIKFFEDFQIENSYLVTWALTKMEYVSNSMEMKKYVCTIRYVCGRCKYMFFNSTLIFFTLILLVNKYNKTTFRLKMSLHQKTTTRKEGIFFKS